MSNSETQYMVNIDFVEREINIILDDASMFTDTARGLFEMCSRIISTVSGQGESHYLWNMFDNIPIDDPTEGSRIIECILKLKSHLRVLRLIPLVKIYNDSPTGLYGYRIPKSYLENLGIARVEVNYDPTYYLYSREIMPFAHPNILDQFNTSRAVMLL